MAYTESGEIANGSSYNLGSYSFTLQNVVSEGERVLQAHMSGPGGSAAHGISVSTSTQVESWYVETNETEASVYARVRVSDRTNKTFSNGGFYVNISNAPSDIECYWWTGQLGDQYYNDCTLMTKTPPLGAISGNNIGAGQSGISQGISFQTLVFNVSSVPMFTVYTIVNADATLVPGWWSESGGGSEDNYTDVLVGRFAIDIEDAGGDGPGSDWDDPGDWNEDPNTVLYVEGVGALSGRHNDPIFNASYSYIPADKSTVKQYGSGGDGGHGGGGGAGASTVIIHRMGTNKANSHESTALAKRHGYGSGGGKGGKAGDGIILVYY